MLRETRDGALRSNGLRDPGLLRRSGKRARGLVERTCVALARAHGNAQTLVQVGMRVLQVFDDFEILAPDARQIDILDVHQPQRLIFTPTASPPPSKPDGGLDWEQVDSVTIIEIIDYH